MAEIPVDGATVILTGGTYSGSAVSDSSGKARITLRLSEPQYRSIQDAVQPLTARATKLGYNDGVGTLRTMPSYANAKASGVSMQLFMQKYSGSQFSVSPTSLLFPAEGGTQTVAITSPDNGWTIDASYISTFGGFVTKTSNTTIDITIPENVETGGRASSVYIRWGTQTRSISVTQAAAEEGTGNILFSGKATQTDTGVAVPSANIAILVRGSNGQDIEAASGITDSSGNYSLRVGLDEFTWNTLQRITIVAEKPGFSIGTRVITSFPSFDSAVANGITSNLTLAPSAQSSPLTIYMGVYVYASGGGINPVASTVKIYGVKSSDGSRELITQTQSYSYSLPDAFGYNTRVGVDMSLSKWLSYSNIVFEATSTAYGTLSKTRIRDETTVPASMELGSVYYGS